MFHEIIVELTVGSMDVMPITKCNTMFDADHINSLFAWQSVRHHFLRPRLGLLCLQRTWGEVL